MGTAPVADGIERRPHGRPARTLRRLGPLAGLPALVPALLVAAPLWVVSALTRWLAPRLEPTAETESLMEYAPEVGARPRAHLATFGRAQEVFRVETDAEGWRGRADLDEADVVALGDSFAFGYGVGEEDLYANRTRRARTKPVAAPAYSMVHGVLWLRRLAPRLSGKQVVWLVFCGNDLADNLRPDLGHYRMPFVSDRSGAWRIETAHVCAEPWAFEAPPKDHTRLVAALSTPTAYADRAFSAASYLIGEAARTCEEAGAGLTVVSIPHTSLVTDPEAVRAASPDPGRYDPQLVDRRLEHACREHAVAFLPLLPRLRPRHYWADDMHFRPAGHRLLADVVDELARPLRPNARSAT